MAGQEIDIMNFKNTALYEIAVKSNINGGTTLKGIEIQLFENATAGLEVPIDSFGLKIDGGELSPKTARKNVKSQGSELEKLYKAQFGSQGKQAVESSEERALGIVETAKTSFERNHKEILYTPLEVSKRPMFTESKYSGKPTKYAADLIAWAKDVAAAYDLYDKMSNEEIVAAGVRAIFKKVDQAALDVIVNSNLNTEHLSNEIRQSADSIINEINAGTAKVISAVHSSEGRITATIRTESGKLAKLIVDEAGNVMSVVHAESAITRNEVREQGARTRNTVRKEEDKTRNTVREEAVKGRNTTRQTAQETQEIDTANHVISERLKCKNASTQLTGKVSKLQQKIVESNLTHEKKMELLHELAGITFTEKDLDKFVDKVEQAVSESSGQKSEELPKEVYTDFDEEPYYEDPFPQNSPNGNGSTTPKSISKDKGEDAKPDGKANDGKTEQTKEKEPSTNDPVVEQNDVPSKKVKNKKSVKDIINKPEVINKERKEKDKTKTSIFRN